MNKNSIIGVVLIFTLMIGYTYFTAPSKEEIAKQKHIQDSLLIEKLKQDSANFTNEQLREKDTHLDHVVNSDSVKLSALIDNFGSFAPSLSGENKQIIVENENFKLFFNLLGGRIAKVELKKYKTFNGELVTLFDPDSSTFNLVFFSKAKQINTSQLYFKLINENENNFTVSGSDSLNLILRLYASADSLKTDSYIDFKYKIYGDQYLVALSLDFVNMKNIIDNNSHEMYIDMSAKMLRQEKNAKNEKENSTIYYSFTDGETDYLNERKNEQKVINERLKWVSFKQQFFCYSIIADNFIQNADLAKKSDDTKEQKYIQNFNAGITFPFNVVEDKNVSFSLYMGPNKYSVLSSYNINLERQIPLGWSFFLIQWINRFVVLTAFNVLGSLNLNYGIVILILTVLIKIFLFPLAYKTYISSAKMRLMKPEVDEIGKKFPKPEDALKKQQATMELYRKVGVSPMSGCIPMLLQMPILFAMFRFFPASIELRQQAFLWADDLSSYDSILNLPFTIPFYGDHVSLFTLLMTISTIIYTRINNKMMSTGQSFQGANFIMYLMPIVFLGVFNNYSSGLSYYYLLANLFTFAQMFFIRRFINEDKLHAQLQANKNKKHTKSKFQARLEQISKQQQLARNNQNRKK